MKIVSMTCPNCGATLQVDADNKNVTCNYCGNSLFIDDETSHVKIDNPEQVGYDFEKGRQRAQAEQRYNQSNTYAAPRNYTTPKKRKTWLWVLGWLFVFPLPLTIILVRKKDMKPILKYGIIAVAWILYLIIGLAGSPSDAGTNETTPSNVIEQTVEHRSENKSITEKEESSTVNETTTLVEESRPTEEKEPIALAEDQIVNQFMVDYNTITNSPITDISKGNIRTKYYFKTYGFRIEIINATSAAAGYTSVSINGNADFHVPEMRDVFHDVVKTFEHDLSDEEIYTFFDEKTVYGNCAHETPLGSLICSVYLTGNFDENGRIDIHN